MAQPRTLIGPPPDNRHYISHDGYPDDQFDQWEQAWAEHLGVEYEPMPNGNIRVQPKHADPFEGDPERKRRFQEAVAYIAAYEGRWDFILSLRQPPPHGKWGTKWFRLSDRQVEVILNAKARDKARALLLEREATGIDLTALPFGRTYAAVDNDSGGVTFLIFDRPEELDRFKRPNKWYGWVFVKQQISDQESRLGAQRPGQTYVGQWPNLINRVLEDIPAAVIRYGKELGVCGVCGRTLTNDESREMGIGPVCLNNL